MPKDANILPNERIDIPDFKQGTSVVSRGANRKQRKLVFQDQASVIAEGFRVEIADQGASPGLFTIYNGIGYDREGEILNNEEDVAASRSFTLGSDGTFYIEVVFSEVESDSDARAFWDPTFNTGSVPGREFSQTVATRLTPDWEIYEPVSTTGFNYDSDPSSLRVPVAVLTVSGGQITGGTTAQLSSIIGEDSLLAATSIRLLNTRAMPQSFTLRLDPGGASQEDVTVINNDQENGILTLSAGAGFAHTAGERAITVGSGNFLIERVATAIPTTGTEDARPRFYQGNEERGALVGLDPTGTGADRTDAQVENLKRYVDFLAAQLREVKFGSQLEAEVGSLAPPTSFSNPPRYYERAGGLMPARTNTVSVGDGVNSFGDYNELQMGSAAAAIQAAVDSMGAAGGTVYIKKGDYTVATTVELTAVASSVKLVGEGENGTILRTTGGDPILRWAPSGAGKLVLEDLQLLSDAGAATRVLEITDNCDVHATRCVIDGIDSSGNTSPAAFYDCDFGQPSGGTSSITGTWTGARFDKCRFTGSVVATLTNAAFTQCAFSGAALGVDSTMTSCLFDGCSFAPTAGAANRGARLSVTSIGVSFRDCSFDLSTDNAYGIELTGGAETCGDLKVEGCTFTGGASTSTGILIGAGCQTAHVTRCKSDCDNGLVDAQAGSLIQSRDIHVARNNISFTASKTGIAIGVTGGTDVLEGVHISDNQLIQTGVTVASAGCAIRCGYVFEIWISHNKLTDPDWGIYLSNADLPFVLHNEIIHSGDNGRIGIYCVGSYSKVEGNALFNLKGATDNVITGIHVQGSNSKILNNSIQDTGSNLTADTAYAIYVDTFDTDILVQGNTISSVRADATVAAGIYFAGDPDSAKILHNTIEVVNTSTSTGTGAAYGIRTGTPNNGLHIQGNAIRNVGASVAVLHAGILVTSGSSTRNNLIDISHNSITDMVADSFSDETAAITVLGAAFNTHVTNNRVDSSDGDTFGIWISQATDTSSRSAQLNVSDNTIANRTINLKSVEFGIYIEIPEDGTDAYGRAIVSRNMVDQAVNGIFIQGDIDGGGHFSLDWVISENVIKSDQLDADGITCVDLAQKSINGNVITLGNNNSQDHTAIYCVGGFRSSINGNVITMGGASGGFFTYCIDADEVQTLCTNNIMWIGGTWTAESKVVVGSNNFLVGNMIEGATDESYFSSGALNMVAHGSRTGVTGNRTIVPGALNDINLNIDD